MTMADLRYQKFGRLTPICTYRVNGLRHWECLCDCGGFAFPTSTSLAAGRSQSCGCLRRERTSAVKFIHGASRTLTHQSWMAMITRCSDTQSKRYGGRGIVVAEEWKDFAAFLADMGERPGAEFSIERRDNDGDYTRENCYWATRAVQVRNRHNNVYLTFDGRSMTVTDWAAEIGLTRTGLHNRLFKRKWSVERALTTPKKEASQ